MSYLNGEKWKKAKISLVSEQIASPVKDYSATRDTQLLSYSI
jgi:hypothetical protein